MKKNSLELKIYKIIFSMLLIVAIVVIGMIAHKYIGENENEKESQDVVEAFSNIDFSEITEESKEQLEYKGYKVIGIVKIPKINIEYPILEIGNIDPELRQEIWEELRNQANQGKTILITTHVMDEAERCDVVLMLRNGKFIAEGSPKEIKEKYQVASVEEAFIVAGKNLELENKGAAK